MESHSAELPLRVCPRCAVAARTNSETCPNCGRRYRRRYRLAGLAVLVVALAFGVGFGVRALLSGDDSTSNSISSGQANALGGGTSRQRLDEIVGDAKPISVRPLAGGGSCVTYASSDSAHRAWLFCFQNDELVERREIQLP